MSSLDHILLFLLLFFVFFLITKNNQKTLDKRFWYTLIVPIVLYSLILGCRYGWGHDYPWYKYRFEHPYGFEDESIGFRILNLAIAGIGGNYVVAFITYSLVFIIGAFVFIRDIKDNKYMLFFFLPATLLTSTFTIRQSVATSFLFLALHSLHHKKWLWGCIWVIIMYSIHSAVLMNLVVLVPLYFFLTKPITIKVTIPLYVLFVVASSYFTNLITPVLERTMSMITFGNGFDSYTENADRFFGTDAEDAETYAQGTLTLVLSSLFHIAILYIGYIALKYNPNKLVGYVYNAVVFGLLMLRPFFLIELLHRTADSFVQFYFIPVGWALANYSLIEKRERFLYKGSIVMITVYLLLYYGRFIFQSPKYHFVWNL